MAAGTVARPRLADGRADQDAGCGVMAAGAAVVGGGRSTDQGVVVAVGTTGRSDGDKTGMVDRRSMLSLPGAGMTSGTVAADRKGGAEGRADQAAIRIVTAAAGIVSLGCSTDQGVVVAEGAAGAADCYQHGVVDGRGVLDRPAAGMAGHTVAAADRDPGLQGQSGRVRVAVEAIVQVDRGHGTVIDRTRVVTGQTRCRVRHIAEIHMVDVPGQGLVGMAIQAMGRGGTQGEGVDDLLPRAVMTGGTGPGAVGRNIVLDAFNLRPVRNDMAVAAELTRRIIREVVGTDFPGMRKAFIMIGPLGNVAVGTADYGPVQALLNGLPHDSGIKPCAGVGVTDGTVSHRDNTVQGVEVGSAGQESRCRLNRESSCRWYGSRRSDFR